MGATQHGARPLVWGTGRACGEPFIWGVLSGFLGNVLLVAGTCSDGTQSLGRGDLRTFGGGLDCRKLSLDHT